MERFDPKLISVDEKNTLIERINSKSKEKDLKGDIIWIPPPNKKTGYPEILLPRNLAERFNMFSPRNPGHMLFAIKNGQILKKVNHDMSHLCNNKLCVNPEHLVYEPRWVNNARKNCVKEGKCTGHHVEMHNLHFDNCIF